MSNDGNKLTGLWAAAAGGVSQVPPPPASLGLRVPPPPNALSQLFGRPSVQGLYYNGKTIPLDGYQFVGCRFDNCTLVVMSTNFELINCVIDPVTVIEYGIETLKIVHLFNSRSEWAYASAPGLAPRKNADGTITIDGRPNGQ